MLCPIWACFPLSHHSVLCSSLFSPFFFLFPGCCLNRPDDLSGPGQTCPACYQLDEEEEGRRDERRKRWAARKKELAKGKWAWGQSTVVFPAMGENRLCGLGVRQRRSAYLTVAAHGANCAFGSMPRAFVPPLWGPGQMPPNRGQRGWEFIFRVDVLLVCPGDVGGRWEATVPLRGTFTLPPPFAGLFRRPRLRLRGSLTIEGGRPARKIGYRPKWESGEGDRTGLQASEELGDCPMILRPWEWGVHVVFTPHPCVSVWRVALSLVSWSSLGARIGRRAASTSARAQIGRSASTRGDSGEEEEEADSDDDDDEEDDGDDDYSEDDEDNDDDEDDEDNDDDEDDEGNDDDEDDEGNDGDEDGGGNDDDEDDDGDDEDGADGGDGTGSDKDEGRGGGGDEEDDGDDHEEESGDNDNDGGSDDARSSDGGDQKSGDGEDDGDAEGGDDGDDGDDGAGDGEADVGEGGCRRRRPRQQRRGGEWCRRWRWRQKRRRGRRWWRQRRRDRRQQQRRWWRWCREFFRERRPKKGRWFRGAS